MADDTREPTASPGTPPTSDASPPPPPPAADADTTQRPIRRPRPKHDFPQSQAGKLWDAFGNPENAANTLPGGTYNSAGGKPPPVTWRDAFNFSYDSKGPAWYQVPCARDSLLVGIGGGGAVGGLSFILKGVCVATSLWFGFQGWFLSFIVAPRHLSTHSLTDRRAVQVSHPWVDRRTMRSADLSSLPVPCTTGVTADAKRRLVGWPPPWWV